MEKSLAYLRESLSNWTDRNETAKGLFSMIEHKKYHDEKEFIDDLGEEEVVYLTDMLPYELKYAKNEKDEVRFESLNKIYELLD
jgi:hypothetical protein